MPEAYVYAPLTCIKSTRILRLNPNRDPDAPLECELEEISLDGGSTRSYEALSYVWGAAPGKGHLICAGRTIDISANCEVALRYLRHKKDVVTLWVDAVSINQHDAAERAQQVSLMGSIYRRATSVIIWLGEGTQNTARCFARLPLWRKAIKSGLFFRKLNTNKTWGRMVFLNLTGNMDLHEYAYLMDNEWAKRVWTIQEFALAHTLKVVCGSSTASWEDFHSLVYEGNLPMIKAGVAPFDVAHTWDDAWNIRDLVMSSLEMWRMIQECPGHELTEKVRMGALVALVVVAHLNRTTEARDKAFALYGLLAELVGDSLPKIDYGLGTDEIFTGLTRALILVTNSFWPPYTGTGMIIPHSTMPSWVPDLDYQTEQRAPSLRAAMTYRMNLKKQAWRSDPSLDFQQTNDSRVLTLRGTILSAIKDTGLRWPSRSDPGPPISMEVHALHAWYRFYLISTGKLHLYRHLEDTPAGFLSLMFDGEKHEDEKKYSAMFPKMMEWFFSFAPHLLSTNWEARVVEDMQRVSFFGRSNLVGSIIFELEGGYVGRSMGQIEKGDVVVLLAACEVPVMLRKEGEHWRYLGPAYVAYNMDSAKWPSDDSDLVLFNLI